MRLETTKVRVVEVQATGGNSTRTVAGTYASKRGIATLPRADAAQSPYPAFGETQDVPRSDR